MRNPHDVIRDLAKRGATVKQLAKASCLSEAFVRAIIDADDIVKQVGLTVTIRNGGLRALLAAYGTRNETARLSGQP